MGKIIADWFRIQNRTGSTFRTNLVPFRNRGSILCSVINPFQVTKPVDPSEVIDRAGETRQLIDLALESNNARLVAPRRFGKTSLLKRVQVELDNQGWIPVYVDLLGIISADDFTAWVERAYTRQLTGQ